MAKAKKKRTWTKAMREAFARKMKRARKKKSGPKKKTTKKATSKKQRKPVLRKVSRHKTTKKKEVIPMAKKRKSRKASGSSGTKRRSRRGGGGFSKKDIMSHVKDAAIAIGGGVVAGMVANKVPIPNPLLKAASPAILGAVLLMTLGRKNKMVGQMATGMMVLGGVSTIRAAFPNVPLLAGEEEVVLTPDEMRSLEYSGVDDDGDIDDMMGVEEFSPVMGVEDFSGVDDDDDLDMMGSEEPFLTASSM